MNETHTATSHRKWLFPLLTLLLAAVMLYFALRNVNWHELFSTMRQANPALLLLAFAALSVSCLVRGMRWRLLLSAQRTMPVVDVFWALMTGYLGNAYLPARAGELIRSMLVGQKGGISKSFSLATALTERIVDAVILVIVSTAALSTMPVLPEAIAGNIKIFSVIGLAALAVIIAAPRMGRIIYAVLARLPIPERFCGPITGMVEKLLMGAGALQHPVRLSGFLLCSAAIWSLDTVAGLMTARAFGLALNPVQVFVLLAALGLFSAIPSTPGYVGVYQLVAVSVLVPFGLSEAESVAYIFGYQGVNYAVITVWGLIGLWKLRGAARLLRAPVKEPTTPA